MADPLASQVVKIDYTTTTFDGQHVEITLCRGREPASGLEPPPEESVVCRLIIKFSSAAGEALPDPDQYMASLNPEGYAIADPVIVSVHIAHADPITATLLQRFPWARWLEVARDVARAGGATPVVRQRITKAIRRELGIPNPPGRKGHPHEWYRMIAERYLSMRAQGVSAPTATLAEELGYNRNTVAGMIRRARQLGYLPPGQQGRAG